MVENTNGRMLLLKVGRAINLNNLPDLRLPILMNRPIYLAVVEEVHPSHLLPPQEEASATEEAVAVAAAVEAAEAVVVMEADTATVDLEVAEDVILVKEVARLGRLALLVHLLEGMD